MNQVKITKVSNGFIVSYSAEKWFCKSLAEVGVRVSVAFEEMSAVEAGFELNKLALAGK